MNKTSVLVFIAVTVWWAPALADTPLLPVQGVLTDTGGTPIEGTHEVHFAFYDRDSGGTAIYIDTHSVSFTAGDFVAYVALDPTVFEGGPQMWLGITVEGDVEMEPRVRLGAAPTAAYAHLCGDAATLDGATSQDFAPMSHEHPDTGGGLDLNSFEVSATSAWDDYQFQEICSAARSALFCALSKVAWVNQGVNGDETSCRVTTSGGWKVCARRNAPTPYPGSRDTKVTCTMRCFY